MTQRHTESCEEVCQEHSGLKTMITVVLVGVAGTLAMQGYNNFVAVADLRSSISAIQANQTDIGRRVSKLEDIVFVGHQTGGK